MLLCGRWMDPQFLREEGENQKDGLSHPAVKGGLPLSSRKKERGKYLEVN